MKSAPVFRIKSLGRFVEPPADSLSDEQRTIAKTFTDRRGSVPTPYRLFLSSPALASRLRDLSDYVLRKGLLTPCEVEIAVLVTAYKMRASFIEVAHRRIAANAGLPESAIDAILSGRDPKLSEVRQQAIFECATAMHSGSPADAGAFDRIIAALGNDGVCEVAGILGFYCTCAFALGFFNVPDPE